MDLSREPSLSGDPPGLRLGLEDRVRGSLYKDLKKRKVACHQHCFNFFATTDTIFVSLPTSLTALSQPHSMPHIQISSSHCPLLNAQPIKTPIKTVVNSMNNK